MHFVIAKKMRWWKGFASCTIFVVCGHTIHQLDLIKIPAGYYERNAGSKRPILEVGFLVEKRQSFQWEPGGNRRVRIAFGKTNPKHVV
jgi:hypothetical protein